MLTHLLAATLLAVPARQDSVRVYATMSDDTIIVGEAIRIEITVESNRTPPRAIAINGLPAPFDVISRETHTSSGLTGDGRVITTEAWLVLVREPGTYTIPGARIEVDRRTLRTRSLTLVVLAGRNTPRVPDPVSHVRLRGRIEPERIYVGQQVTFVGEAEFPRSLRQRQTRPATYQAPDPSGFWAQDLPDPIVSGLRNIDGELYDTQSFRRAYFPLLPGRQTFPPARLSFEYRGSLGLLPQSRELLSDTLRIDVLPVPEEGRPSSYNGAVGRYTMRASVDADRLRVGEAATLVVEVTGKGNVKSLPAPDLHPPAGIEVFPPAERAEVETSSLELGGTKRFEWVIVPGEPGRIAFPPVEYAAFDPLLERFDVMRSDSIVLNVTGQRADPAAGIELRPIRGRPSGGTPSWVLSPAFAAAQVLPLLLILLAAWSVRERTGPGLRRINDERARRFHALQSEALAADRGFWGRLTEAVRVSIADALGRPELRTAPVETLLGAMTSAGVARATASAIADLLRNLDRIRYAPGEVLPADAPAMVDRARQLLDTMAAALAKSSSRAPAAAAGAIVVLFASAGHAQEPAFQRAVTAYRSADYDAAAAAFLEHVAEHPTDADGWYDAGNALFRTGATGRAVASWMRAVKLRPRHGDARANLEAVSPSALSYVPPFVSMTAGETVLVLAGIWWIAALLVALRIRSRMRLGPVVLAAVGAALVVGMAGLAGAGQRPVAVSLDEAVVRSDPALKSDALVRLPTGVPVELVDRRDGWLRVRTEAGVEGWVDASLVAEA